MWARLRGAAESRITGGQIRSALAGGVNDLIKNYPI